MNKAFLALMLLLCHPTLAQKNIPTITKAYLENANSPKLFQEDDLTPLITPLSDLKLDKGYMLMDFRRTKVTGDNSALRLAVRKRGTARPQDEYLDKEYRQYKACMDKGRPYPTEGKELAYISPFSKIKVKNTDEGIWQAVLLFSSKNLFGMRWHGNYQRAHLITCREDIDSVLSVLSEWEGGNLENVEIRDDVHKLAFKLREISDPCPTFTRDANTVYVRRYIFWEFRGLVEEVLAVAYDSKKRQVSNISVIDVQLLAKYVRKIYF